MDRDLGLEVSLEDRNVSIIDLQTFQRLFKEQVLAPDDKMTSTAIMVLPVGPGQPIYRDIAVPFVKRYGIDPLNLAALLRIPQLVVPSMCLLARLPRRHSFDTDFLFVSWAEPVRIPCYRQH